MQLQLINIYITELVSIDKKTQESAQENIIKEIEKQAGKELNIDEMLSVTNFCLAYQLSLPATPDRKEILKRFYNFLNNLGNDILVDTNI